MQSECIYRSVLIHETFFWWISTVCGFMQMNMSQSNRINRTIIKIESFIYM